MDLGLLVRSVVSIPIFMFLVYDYFTSFNDPTKSYYLFLIITLFLQGILRDIETVFLMWRIQDVEEDVLNLEAEKDE